MLRYNTSLARYWLLLPQDHKKQYFVLLYISSRSPVLTLVCSLSSCPGKEAGDSISSQENIHLIRLFKALHPVSVVPVRYQMELSVPVACWVWQLGAC